MKLFALCLYFGGLTAASAQANDAQTSLARQIEKASTTSNQADYDTGEGVGWTLYPPLIYRREMQVRGCDVTARTVKINLESATEIPSVEIMFDLTRTHIPEPSVSTGEEYAFAIVDVDEPYGTALFELRFSPPYEPVIWSTTASQEVEQAVLYTRFLMEPVADETQPRRLLALLNQYQVKYCSLSG